jgi:ATP-dependent protease HslVU (ClpYQ) peptidase subunit
MVVPEVVSPIVTDCDVVYVPAAGENVGAGKTVLMVYAAVATELLVKPVLTAIASSVSDALTVIALLYTLDDVVGVVPFVV